MTDKEKFLALLEEWGIEPHTGKYGDFGQEVEHEVVLMAGQGGVEGYRGFHTVFEFDEHGKFKLVGAWE